MTHKQPISNSLRFHRKQACLRQLDVARVLGLGSTDRISRWEKGSTFPHVVNLFKLFALYKVPPHQLYEELYQAIQMKVCQFPPIQNGPIPEAVFPFGSAAI